MIIPLDKLTAYNKNKFEFTKAAMQAVDKIQNIRDYPEEDLNWKIVPNILSITLTEKVKFQYKPEDESTETEAPELEEGVESAETAE